jgi:hypothetical protein
VQLIATASESTLAATRAVAIPTADGTLDEAFAPLARQAAASLVPRLPAARAARARSASP